MKKFWVFWVLISFGICAYAQNSGDAYVSQDLCTKDSPKKHIFLSSSGYCKLTDGTWKKTYFRGTYVIKSNDEIIFTYKENDISKTLKGKVVWLYKIEGQHMQLDYIDFENQRYSDVHCN